MKRLEEDILQYTYVLLKVCVDLHNITEYLNLEG
jgi:hypothetical protein